jgi:glycogen debranching enzyme
MTDTVNLQEQFEILSEAERSSTPLHVLKHGNSFAVFDHRGDVAVSEASEHGLYHLGTRFVSRCELRLAGRQPLLLSSSIRDDNSVFTADLTNPDVVREGRVVVGRGLVHLFRSRVLCNGSWIECVRVSNHGLQPVHVPLQLYFDADFADIFEVRGTRRQARGQRLPSPGGPLLSLRYLGRDGVERRTEVHSLVPPDRSEDGSLTFLLSLDPHAHREIEFAITCDVAHQATPVRRYAAAVKDVRRLALAQIDGACQVVSSNHVFNKWFERSSSDLRMMITETPFGPYPYAGIPWFSTPFGRDGIITALELLWAEPKVARGVLSFLANTQATALDDASDAQPGKILHEMRSGEMAALGEIPFGRYYGTADATPLFAMLAHAYFERTADLPFIDHLWPHILAALEWIDRYGDPDGDGLVEYARRSSTGLIQQGWKDSWDSVFHDDGSLAAPPIALCEIQGYAYAAWIGAARLAAARGDDRLAGEFDQRAARLRERFEKAFWCDDIGTYALALDGEKRPCRIRASNPGHCLFTGIASLPHAARTADTLMDDRSFGGWGIRTVAAGAARYNPMSYHNGSVWPHDNALAAAGLARYGFTEAALRVFDAMFDLSQAVALHRLPELICGFHRRAGDAPTLYPVACAPQAWAAGAVYLLLQASLGLRVDGIQQRVLLNRAMLPQDMDWLRIVNLSVGSGSVDLLMTRHEHDVGVTVLRRDGPVEIMVAK